MNHGAGHCIVFIYLPNFIERCSLQQIEKLLGQRMRTWNGLSIAPKNVGNPNFSNPFIHF